MLAAQKNYLTEQLNHVIQSLGYKPISPEWRNIPFLGAWGLATSIAYRLASQELEGIDLDKKERASIARERAPEIAQQIAEHLSSIDKAGRVEADGAYVNVYFDVPGLTAQLVETVLTEGQDYGRGAAKATRVMVEYSQPNTHKVFHVGHLRNVCLGHSLALILDFAGFDIITANYIGDIGMHVIKCLWCYSRFHEGEEPVQDRGKWLGQVYTEADQRINVRNQVTDLIRDVIGLPSFQERVYEWARSHLPSPGRVPGSIPVCERFLYEMDLGWHKIIGELESGIESAIQGREQLDPDGVSPPNVSVDHDVTGHAEPEATVDGLSSVITVKGPGAPLYRRQLEALLSGKTLEASHDIVKMIAEKDGVATAVQDVAPALWPELGSWMRSQATTLGLDAAEGDNAWSPDQQKRLADLLELYEILDNRMEWWPHVDQWNKEIKALFLRWDAKDPEVVDLWEKTRSWSMEEFHEIYDFLGAEFDVWFYESQVEEQGKEIVSDMVEKGLAQDLRPDGPVLIHIDRLLGIPERDILGRPTGEYRTLLILRSDGTSLYSTKDLALAKRKFEEYEVDRSIYVVDVRQAFYFKQVFKALELWGFEQAKDCYHLSYEIVTDPGGAMSSRAGNVIPFEDFATTILERASAIVAEKNAALGEEQRQSIARTVALGAIKYPMLNVDNDKVITFDLEQALSLERQSAPYIQYAHARACRILEKAGGLSEVAPDYGYMHVGSESKPAPALMAEINLIEKIADFPDVVQKAAESYRPLVVATYVFELAYLFSDFYQKCDVVRGNLPDGVRAARLRLVRAAKQTIANGLALLGIEAPEVM